MFPPPGRGSGPRLRHALAGLEAGILGVFLMLACLALGSVLNGREIWVVPNLFASIFFGRTVYQNDYAGFATWSGIAILIAIYGGLGLIWGLAWKENRRPGLTIFGAITGLAVYYLFFHVIWIHLEPAIALYAPDGQFELGHLLWGIALAKSPVFARRIADQTAEPVVAEVDEVIR